MYNVAGRLIRRIFLLDSVYHCVVQDTDGKIYHHRTENEQDALEFVERYDGGGKVRFEKVQ